MYTYTLLYTPYINNQILVIVRITFCRKFDIEILVFNNKIFNFDRLKANIYSTFLFSNKPK